MKKKIRGMAVICAAFGMLVGAAGVYASYQSEVMVKSNMSVGNVDIRVDTCRRKENGEITACDGTEEKVLPSQTVSRIPRVTCLDAPCYIRADISWSTECPEGIAEGDVFTIRESDIHGITSDWIKKGIIGIIRGWSGKEKAWICLTVSLFRPVTPMLLRGRN